MGSEGFATKANIFEDGYK